MTSYSNASDASYSPEVVNLTVALRIRPLNSQEKSRGSTQVAYRVDDRMVVLMDPGDKLDEFLRKKRIREKKFVFDAAFGPQSSQNEEFQEKDFSAFFSSKAMVYGKSAKQLVENVLDGYNATVFAYGATGAGKTYTMLGTDENPGIMALALNDLFTKMEKSEENTYHARISYLEIYNEMIRDLLNPNSGILDLREDSKGNIRVAGLSETDTKSSKDVLQLLMQGNRRRTQEPTAANKTSSRSHAVLQVTVTQRTRNRDIHEKHQIGKLFLIDLAGSERASQTKNSGKRMKEGAHINRSLLALGNVINTLSEKGSKYVNYRDSKLTRLLKDSLGGNSKTMMIAHISPASNQFEESRNTLIYADRAKNISTKVNKNTNDVNHHVSQYQAIISELRKEIGRLKSKIDANSKDQKPLTRSESSNSIMNGRSTARLDSILTNASPQKSDVTQMELNQNSTKRDEEFLRMKDILSNTFREQMTLRHRMMEVNDQAFDIALNLSSKKTVLDAWDRRRAQSGKSSEEPEPIAKLRHDVAALQKQLSKLEEKKSEIEWDYAIKRKKIESLEEALPKKANTIEQKEMLLILSQMHEIEVEKAVLQSDALLLNKRLERQHTSLNKIGKYHSVCDKLITRQNTMLEDSSIDMPADTKDLYHDYKNLRNQAHFHMLPPDEKATEMAKKSWNREMFQKEYEKKSNKDSLSKTLSYAELQRVKSDINQSHSNDRNSASTTKLPPIDVSQYMVSKDDTEINYGHKRENDYSLDSLKQKVKARRESLTSVESIGSRKLTVSPASSRRGARARSKSQDYSAKREHSESSSKTSIPVVTRGRKKPDPNRRITSPNVPKLPSIIRR